MTKSSESMDLFAVCAPGLEEAVRSELAGIAISAEAAQGGVAWSGGREDLYRANLHLRTASRVLVRVARFRARSFIELERHARRIEWSPFIAAEAGVRLRVTSRKSRLYHERGIAERFGRWIREDAGAGTAGVAGAEIGGDEEEGGDADAGTSPLVIIRLFRDECIVSVDSSGPLLHRRGYRQALARAPLRETLAAATIMSSGWHGGAPLLDPLCGAGTIPIEAALIARRIPPGLAMADREPRAFAFQNWRAFDDDLWRRVVADGRARIRPVCPVPIQGSDRDEGAIEAARANAQRAGLDTDVELRVTAVSGISPPAGETPGFLITNPPYGVRVGESRPLRDLYATLGAIVRDRLPGWEIAILSADDQLERQMGIELRELLRTNNGGIPVRVMGSTGGR